MKTKHLISGVIVAVLLFGIWLTVEQPLGSQRSESTSLLEGVSPDSLQKLRIIKNDQEIVLRRGDAGWLLASRADYPADANKVRSLLLKLFDLGSAQTLPSSEKSYEKLGVGDDSYTKGYSKVELFGKGEKPEAQILLGKSREGNSGGGQYIRRESKEAVSLISVPVTLETEVRNWLETQVVNVREAVVYGIEQYSIAEEQATRLFSFERQLSENGEFGRLELQQPDDVEAKLEESVVAQVRGALENVRMTDVRAAEGEQLEFDSKTVFKLSTGIQYEVSTRKVGDQFEAQVSVSRPEPLVTELQALQKLSEERRAAELAEEGTDSAADEETAADATAVNTDEKKKEAAAAGREPLIRLATEAEATELQERFARWVYILPEFQAKKFRYSFEDLLQKEVSADEVAAAASPSAP